MRRTTVTTFHDPVTHTHTHTYVTMSLIYTHYPVTGSKNLHTCIKPLSTPTTFELEVFHPEVFVK